MDVIYRDEFGNLYRGDALDNVVLYDNVYYTTSCCEKTLETKVEEAIKKLDEVAKENAALKTTVDKLKAKHNAQFPAEAIAYSGTDASSSLSESITAFHGVLSAMNSLKQAVKINRDAALYYMKQGSGGENVAEARKHLDQAAKLLR